MKQRSAISGKYINRIAAEQNPAEAIAENELMLKKVRALKRFVKKVQKESHTSDTDATEYLNGLLKALSFFEKDKGTD